MIRVPSSIIDVWGNELSTRRRECYDALLDLRLSNRLSWQRDPMTWDALFRSCSELHRSLGSWRDPLPSEVRQVLFAHATEVAAVASEVVWYVSRDGGFASQRFKPRGLDFLTTIEVYAVGPRGIDTVDAQRTEGIMRLGLVARAEDDAELQLSWSGFNLPREVRSGERSGTLPDQLRRAISARRC
jgi:hypothetical protein